MITAAMWKGDISIITTFPSERDYKNFIWMHDYKYCGDASYCDDNNRYLLMLLNDEEEE